MRTGTSKSRFDFLQTLHVLVLNFRQNYFFPFNNIMIISFKEFMDSNPSLSQIKSEMQHYSSFEQDIDDIKPIIVLGIGNFIELSTGKAAVMCFKCCFCFKSFLFFFKR